MVMEVVKSLMPAVTTAQASPQGTSITFIGARETEITAADRSTNVTTGDSDIIGPRLQRVHSSNPRYKQLWHVAKPCICCHQKIHIYIYLYT